MFSNIIMVNADIFESFLQIYDVWTRELQTSLDYNNPSLMQQPIRCIFFLF